jgi:Fe-S cluster biogenesis protein NfuA
MMTMCMSIRTSTKTRTLSKGVIQMTESVVNGLQERVQEALDMIRPALQADGGDVELVEIAEGGIVRVRLQGACGGCPMASMTLQMGIERTLKQQVPEVTSVESVDPLGCE